jgi:hypothetical protein
MLSKAGNWHKNRNILGEEKRTQVGGIGGSLKNGNYERRA